MLVYVSDLGRGKHIDEETVSDRIGMSVATNPLVRKKTPQCLSVVHDARVNGAHVPIHYLQTHKFSSPFIKKHEHVL